MAQKQGIVVIRTKMSEALLAACAEVGGRASKPTRRMVRHILTVAAKGYGVKYDSSRGKKKKPAESAVEMKEAA